MCSKNSSRIVFVAHNRPLGITWQVCRVPAGCSAHTGTVPALFLRANIAFCLLPLAQDSFLCRLEAMSSVCCLFSTAAGPSQAVSMGGWPSGSSSTENPETGGNLPWDVGLCGLMQALLSVKGTLLAVPGTRKSELWIPHSLECSKTRSDGALTTVVFVEGVPAHGRKIGTRWDDL